jgi:hypothetical protein
VSSKYLKAYRSYPEGAAKINNPMWKRAIGSHAFLLKGLIPNAP